jgi:hypothetical protein
VNRFLRFINVSTNAPIVGTSQHLDVIISSVQPSSLLNQHLRDSRLMPWEKLIIYFLD